MSYTHVFFDWDGTLAQTLEVWMIAKKETFAEYGVHLTRHEVGETLGDLTAHNTKYGIDLVEFDQILLDKVNQRMGEFAMYEGAMDMLNSLRDRGITLALLTTTSMDIWAKDAKRLGVFDYFDYVITGDMTNNHKPHPEIINRALKHYGVMPNKALMVGDSSKDLGAANAAGVDVVLFHHPDKHGDLYDINYLKAEFKPTYIIDDLGQLTKLVLSQS